jgi:hypothetical protein
VCLTSPMGFSVNMQNLIDIGKRMWKCMKNKQAHIFLYRFRTFSGAVPDIYIMQYQIEGQ